MSSVALRSVVCSDKVPDTQEREGERERGREGERESQYNTRYTALHSTTHSTTQHIYPPPLVLTFHPVEVVYNSGDRRGRVRPNGDGVGSIKRPVRRSNDDCGRRSVQRRKKSADG